jgi:hypothetical protein
MSIEICLLDASAQVLLKNNGGYQARSKGEQGIVNLLVTWLLAVMSSQHLSICV